MSEAKPRVLRLPLKRIYFEAIIDGIKPFEYRLTTDYWTKRIVGQHYDEIEFTLGYPPAGDLNRRFTRPWRGYLRETITHPHFGREPVEVFAIRCNEAFQ
jgi:hypothetical protein